VQLVDYSLAFAASQAYKTSIQLAPPLGYAPDLWVFRKKCFPFPAVDRLRTLRDFKHGFAIEPDKFSLMARQTKRLCLADRPFTTKSIRWNLSCYHFMFAMIASCAIIYFMNRKHRKTLTAIFAVPVNGNIGMVQIHAKAPLQLNEQIF